MNNRRITFISILFILILSACAKQAQPALPTAALIQPTEAPTKIPTEVPTEVPTEAPFDTDPSLFGALSKSEIDPFASNIQDAIFSKSMDGFIASRNIIEYRIIASEVFPSSEGGLIAEFYYNVRTTDLSWLVDGGTQSDGNWIKDKCNRFDFVNTETEFQLKNRRTCN
ncbi:MAG TPA: hypothetical protein VLA72_12480 [Anaerolineales bacterium]|nr:hypothetical protein [Anaerolineales bacterium]